MSSLDLSRLGRGPPRRIPLLSPGRMALPLRLRGGMLRASAMMIALAVAVSVGAFSGTFFARGEQRPAPAPLNVGYISDPISEFRTDVDGDGLFDALVLRIPFVVNESGHFSLQAWMTANGASAANFTNLVLSAGTHVVDLVLPGWRIRLTQTDGPYAVEIGMNSDVNLFGPAGVAGVRPLSRLRVPRRAPRRSSRPCDRPGWRWALQLPRGPRSAKRYEGPGLRPPRRSVLARRDMVLRVRTQSHVLGCRDVAVRPSIFRGPDPKERGRWPVSRRGPTRWGVFGLVADRIVRDGCVFRLPVLPPAGRLPRQSHRSGG